MSMTVRQVINALIDAKDLDKECVIEVNKDELKNVDDNWVQLDVGNIVNLMWGSVIEAKVGDEE